MTPSCGTLMKYARVAMWLALVGATACNERATSVLGPTPQPQTPPQPVINAVYEATFKASASCMSGLPSVARERTYTATFRSDGRIDWSGPTLKPPSGHWPISSGTLAENVLSFSIDVDRDPQSDDFHGLWDNFSDGSFLTISGKGLGELRDGEITGAMNGQFAFFPAPGSNGYYCQAADHQFRFVRQPQGASR